MKTGMKTDRDKVLIIDDDRKLCGLVQDYLRPHGYDVSVAYEGRKGLEMLDKKTYQAVILDVMLPGIDGFEVLRILRRDHTVPVLMLTSRGDETDRIVGLEMGADDYLPKTFSTRELLARLRAVIRRSNTDGTHPKGGAEHITHSGPVRIDYLSRTVTVHGNPIELTPVEFEILFHLVRSAGRVLSRDQLLDRVAGRDYDVFDRSIDVHISSLRRKLNDNLHSPRFIKTVRSVGYMFVCSEQE